MQYFQKNEDQYKYDDIAAAGCFVVDYKIFTSDPELLEIWPKITDDLYENPSHTLAAMSLAMHQVKFTV